MNALVINGGKKLFGEVNISGAKNAAVAIIPAALLCEGTCRIENLPDVQDIQCILNIITTLGAHVTRIDRNTVEIDALHLTSHEAVDEAVRKMRGSYYLLGALVGRFGKAVVSLPGGCDFGERPVDQHKKGFEAMGATVDLMHGRFEVSAPNLLGNTIYLDMVSVGATINIMIGAVRAKGMTIIENAAKEPHVVDVANFLNSMGADIKGAGTDIIRIKGVSKLRGCTYTMIPDQIEAGTFMIVAAGAGGNVLVKNVIPKHLEAVTAKLHEMKVTVEEYDDSIRVIRDGPLYKANIKTLPYPGFPTDLQPLIVTLLTMAKGTSVVTESVWESRFQYVDELRRMGAAIIVSGRTAIIEGKDELQSTRLKATDLRAGAGMVVAGLMASGQTVVSDLRHIDRGYEHFEEKLRSLGADILRAPDTLT